MSENSWNPIIEHLKDAEDMIRLLPLSEEYYRGLVSTVLSLLAQLRNSSNMEIFLQIVMKACCEFYQADWAGILIADATSGMWTVEWRYDTVYGPMAETTIGEDECFEEFPLWVNALKTGEPIILNNIDALPDGAKYGRVLCERPYRLSIFISANRFYRCTQSCTIQRKNRFVTHHCIRGGACLQCAQNETPYQCKTTLAQNNA